MHSNKILLQVQLAKVIHDIKFYMPYAELLHRVRVKSLQLCQILCDPLDCSLPGSSVHWILQATIVEWVPMPSSRGSSRPRQGVVALNMKCFDLCQPLPIINTSLEVFHFINKHNVNLQCKVLLSMGSQRVRTDGRLKQQKQKQPV